jgi:hypothetical protein
LLAATLQRANIMVSELTIALMLQLSQVVAPGLNPETATILAEEMGWVTVKQCSRPVPHPVEGVWRPDKETIVRLEKALAPALVDALRRAPIPEFRRYPPSDYYRQYVGLVVDGKRVVYVNGFHRKFLEISTRSGRTPDWRTTPINVCDGAELFFGAEFEVAAGRVENVYFNGNLGASSDKRIEPTPLSRRGAARYQPKSSGIWPHPVC